MYSRHPRDEGYHATQFRCGMKLWRELVKHSEEQERSINGIITEAVKEYLKIRKGEYKVISP